MKLSTLLTINAVVAGVFGVAFVLVPGQVFSLYGAQGSDALTYMGRLFGAAILGYAVLSWFARDVAESEARRAIVLALFIGYVAGFVLSLIGQLGGVVNALGWSTVAIYLLFTIGFGYFQFMKPMARVTPPMSQ